jgi:hypothetical protein
MAQPVPDRGSKSVEKLLQIIVASLRRNPVLLRMTQGHMGKSFGIPVIISNQGIIMLNVHLVALAKLIGDSRVGQTLEGICDARFCCSFTFEVFNSLLRACRLRSFLPCSKLSCLGEPPSLQSFCSCLPDKKVLIVVRFSCVFSLVEERFKLGNVAVACRKLDRSPSKSWSLSHE